MNPRSNSESDEFYIGYLPAAPTGIARRSRAAVLACVGVSIAAAVVLAASFRAPAPAVWEDQETRFVGELIERPYPMLRLKDAANQDVRRALLVLTGKHGASDWARGYGGRFVQIRGTAVRRDGRLMIEIAGDQPEPVVVPGEGMISASPVVSLGHQTVNGEIIDPKCFLGVMKPGEGKLHKACAIRCIDGGIPPMLAARNAAGQITYYLLVKDDPANPGSQELPANRRVLPFVAEPVAVTGSVYEVDGLRVLRLDETPEAIRRR